ncbi:MAG TPA: S49 family peptidase [Armatimonadota bacterium]|jgi:signal peptide peptidase SppA
MDNLVIHPSAVGVLSGPWAIEERYAAIAEARLSRVDWSAHMAAWEAAQAARGTVDPAADAKPYEVVDGVAILQLTGPMTKGLNSFQAMFGGTSTVALRRSIRQAAADPDVKAILLNVDSPGGSVDGTAALADDVAAAAKKKPTCAYIDGQGCSAAYWVASQATRIDTGRTSIVGSIGTYTTVVDQSAYAESKGVKVHVIRAGTHKGAGVAGAPVTDEQLSEIQGMVDDINAQFEGGVMGGRKMNAQQLAGANDGRVFVGRKALKAGLVDGIGSFDQALNRLRAYNPDRPETAPTRGAREENGMTFKQRFLALLNGEDGDEDEGGTDATATATLAAGTIVAASAEQAALAKLGEKYLAQTREAAQAAYVRAKGQDAAKDDRYKALGSASFEDATLAAGLYNEMADAKLGITPDKGAERQTTARALPGAGNEAGTLNAKPDLEPNAIYDDRRAATAAGGK